MFKSESISAELGTTIDIKKWDAPQYVKNDYLFIDAGGLVSDSNPLPARPHYMNFEESCISQYILNKSIR